MNWFEKLTGFAEENPDQVRSQLSLEGTILSSKVNGRSYDAGRFELLSLNELRNSVPSPEKEHTGMEIIEQIGDVRDYHCMTENAGATFQAASQFNLLEMVHPGVTPEMGIGRYEYDRTQGPACAIACGAGTIYRNYLVEVNGQPGQTEYNQIDCLDGISKALGNESEALWQMKNGYALANQVGLEQITTTIKSMDAGAYEALKGLLKVGVQSETEVTLINNGQKVTQVYCSALPVAYSQIPPAYWEAFAMLILDATYEATFWAALRNKSKTGNNRLFLTLVGGGAFGNEERWIYATILKNIRKFMTYELDVRFISYGQSNPLAQKLINNWDY